MRHEKTKYALPTETLPAIHTRDQLQDLCDLREFLEKRNLSITNTRIERYITYLQRTLSEEPFDAATVFKNSQDARFASPLDWELYVMREVHELNWILKGINIHAPKGLDAKLLTILSGRDFSALDSHSRSRDAQFELRIASYFCQAGCEVDLSTETDIVALKDRENFFVECKRIGSKGQLGKRLSEARKQLTSRMPTKFDKIRPVGLIAVDVTKIGFSNNGLILGVTSEHSRDLIRDKLVEAATDAQSLQLFQDGISPLSYWFQIHLPVLVMQPFEVFTRFSSYHVVREGLDRRALRSLKAFDVIFRSASEAADPRLIPPTPLPVRKIFTFPAGTKFTLQNDLKNVVLRSVSEDGSESQIVGQVTVEGRSHVFTAVDLRLMPKDRIQHALLEIGKDPVKGGVALVVEMYTRRFRFSDPIDVA